MMDKVLVHQIRWILVALLLAVQEGVETVRVLVQVVQEELGEALYPHLPTILAAIREIKRCMEL